MSPAELALILVAACVMLDAEDDGDGSLFTSPVATSDFTVEILSRHAPSASCCANDASLESKKSEGRVNAV